MLTTTNQFKEYIFRKLGSEIHEVEVTSTQWDDILRDSYKEFTEYSGDGSVELITKVTMTSNAMKLSSNVLNIKKILAGTGTTALSDMFGTGEYLIPISISSLYSAGGAGLSDAVSNIISTKQAIANLRNITAVELDFDFNPETKRLVLHTDAGFNNEIIFIGDVAEPIEEILNNKFFTMMVESRCLRQWARNLNIKYDVEDAPIIGNGLKLHPTAMNDEAERLETDWKEGLDENEWDTFLAPRKLYQH